MHLGHKSMNKMFDRLRLICQDDHLLAFSMTRRYQNRTSLLWRWKWSAGSHRHDTYFAFPRLDDSWAIGSYQSGLVLAFQHLLHFNLHRSSLWDFEILPLWWTVCSAPSKVLPSSLHTPKEAIQICKSYNELLEESLLSGPSYNSLLAALIIVWYWQSTTIMPNLSYAFFVQLSCRPCVWITTPLRGRISSSLTEDAYKTAWIGNLLIAPSCCKIELEVGR